MWVILHTHYVLLHALDVYIIVEVNYIFFVPILAWYLHVDIYYALVALEHIRVFVDYVVELNLQSALYLANTVYCAHYHLVK